MSYTHNTCFVSQIALGDGTTYYVCSSSRLAGFDMDGNTYNPYILSVGDANKIGNFGQGSQIGNCSMVLLFGQDQYGAAYNFDISLPWNNAICTIRIRDASSDTTWAGCEDYYYGLIKNFKINSDNLTFDIDEINNKDNQVLPRYTVEKWISEQTSLNMSDIPEDSKGKFIPMQYGNLNSTSTGTFAKGLLICNKIGSQQILFDSSNLYSMTSIGMWENGLKRYFTAIQTNEFTIESSNYRYVEFKVDSTATINEEMTATEGMETISIIGGENLIWDNEDSYDNTDDYPEILSINIIAVDSELMLLIEQPNDDVMRVERGYGDTTVAVHSSGSKIYQCAKFSARNLLKFTETFYPKAVSNFYYYHNLSIYNCLKSGSWNNIINTDNNDYIRIGSQGKEDGNYSDTDINFDLRFEKVENEFTCYGVYVLLKLYYDLKGDLYFHLFGESSSFDSYCPTTNGTETTHLVYLGETSTTRRQYLINTIDNIQRTYSNLSGYYQLSPNIYEANKITGISSGQNESISFTNLSKLNYKWKCHFRITLSDTAAENHINIYRIGFLIDFFASFVDRRIVSVCEGRKITLTDQTVLGYIAATNTLADRPWEMLVDILTEELSYTSTDFDSTTWQAINTYWDNYPDPPTVSLSYGIDEHEQGWILCQDLASQFMLSLTKTDSGTIKLINLHRLQSINVSIGYPSMTAYGISLDDIIMSGGKRQISLQQTGTNLLRNDVKIKYNRNNSTGEYQGCFPGGEQGIDEAYLENNHIMPESGLTLAQARTRYYGGNKTETLIIECNAIYTWTEAYRLWQWHINDKAEIFFLIELTLPYYHYSDINSKSTQYDIGDVIYLDGIYQGITFNSTHRFVIRNITKTDQGRKIKIEAKSIEPISKF